MRPKGTIFQWVVLSTFLVSGVPVGLAAGTRATVDKAATPSSSEIPKTLLLKDADRYRNLESETGLPVIKLREPSVLSEDRYLDLTTCLRLSLEQQGEIKAADENITSAYWRAQEAHRHSVPVVRYQYRLAPVPADAEAPLTSFFSGDIRGFNSFKIEVGAPFYTFGQLSLAQELGDLAVAEAITRKQDKANEVAVKVYQLYYGLLLANEVNKLMDNAITALEENIAKAEKEEYIDQIQILKFKTVTFELYRQLDESHRKQELARRALRIQLGYSQNSNIDFKIIPLSPLADNLENFDIYLTKAHSGSTKRQLLDLGIAARKDQYRLEKRKLAPTLAWGSFFEMGVAPGVEGEETTTSYTRPFNYKKAGMGLQLEGTFDWISARAKVRQAESEYYKTVLQKGSAEDGIELELREAYLEAKGKRQFMTRAQEAQQVAQQIVFLSKSNLDIGIGDKKDYTDALQSYLLFQGRYYEAVYNYNMALVKLKQLSGTLGEEMRALLAKSKPAIPVSATTERPAEDKHKGDVAL